ncbi:hypothetical protein ACZ11_06350 [Lysinibacillus xylanilyticus]|uniref:Uncharacterized protein n=1 Tax=Lysinibacillus xylanilyticus TaxID=582475 RepID=A0A0K9FC41_9BACI|nr:hypothetical protein ACZ11_06350 [Lysinibacillus xylanilyticus]
MARVAITCVNLQFSKIKSHIVRGQSFIYKKKTFMFKVLKIRSWQSEKEIAFFVLMLKNKIFY